MELVEREIVYLWYYIDVQIRQLFVYWLIGILIGSFISVFAKDKIHRLLSNTDDKRILSPLCMYGTVPLAASFEKQGMREDYIASFFVASILLNPQLIIYSMALGLNMAMIRIISCIICGIVAGILIYIFYQNNNKKFFDFSKFDEPINNRDIDNNLFVRYIKNVLRNIKATGLYFFIYIIYVIVFSLLMGLIINASY